VPKCGTGAEVSRIFTVVPKCAMDTSAPVPKCLGSEVSVHPFVPSLLGISWLKQIVIRHSVEEGRERREGYENSCDTKK